MPAENIAIGSSVELRFIGAIVNWDRPSLQEKNDIVVRYREEPPELAQSTESPRQTVYYGEKFP